MVEFQENIVDLGFFLKFLVFRLLENENMGFKFVYNLAEKL